MGCSTCGSTAARGKASARSQINGTVRVTQGRLVAEALTLSMAARLIARLRDTLRSTQPRAGTG